MWNERVGFVRVRGNRGERGSRGVLTVLGVAGMGIEDESG